MCSCFRSDTFIVVCFCGIWEWCVQSRRNWLILKSEEAKKKKGREIKSKQSLWWSYRSAPFLALIRFLFTTSNPPFFILSPINPLGNNAGERNESVVPIKRMDGQLGSGLADWLCLDIWEARWPLARTGLMSPFTCKFREIMRASPCKSTRTRTYTHLGGGWKKEEDVTLNTEEARSPSRREVLEVTLHI